MYKYPFQSSHLGGSLRDSSGAYDEVMNNHEVTLTLNSRVIEVQMYEIDALLW
jgi:hypothetical protein